MYRSILFVTECRRRTRTNNNDARISSVSHCHLVAAVRSDIIKQKHSNEQVDDRVPSSMAQQVYVLALMLTYARHCCGRIKKKLEQLTVPFANSNDLQLKMTNASSDNCCLCLLRGYQRSHWRRQ